MLMNLRRPTGQVDARSQLGRWITLLSSCDSVQAIVEVGTWRGNGTTRRITEGLDQRRVQDARAVCIEADRPMALEAAGRYRRRGDVDVIWGRLVSTADVLDDDLTPEEAGWLAADLERLAAAPLVINTLPAAIDLLILDGGEFTTYAEFMLLRSRVARWIVLDDTKTRKCRRIVESVEAGLVPDFRVVDASAERNGVAVLHRVG
jgi:hypothetical protein